MHILFDYSIIESPTIQTFYFTPEKPMSFIPGQFVEITFPHENPDNRGIKRWFTLSSSPNSSLIGITTRIVSDASSFKNALLALKPQNVITISEPMGDFVLPKDATTPLVFIAGGIGITPFHSIAQWLVEHSETRNIQLLHAIHDEDDIIFTHAFSQAHIPVIHIVSEPTDAWSGERGTLSAEHIVKLSKPANNTLFFIAGPEPMAEMLTKKLEQLGIQKSQLITDYFPGYTGF